MSKQLTLDLPLNRAVEVCTKCGGEIVTVDYPDWASSEYRNTRGECFKCDRKTKR